MSKKYPHKLELTWELKRKMDRAAALLNEDDWVAVIRLGMQLVKAYSEAYVKGRTATVFVSREMADLLRDNQDFFCALCEEGVIEWLKPLVLAGGHAQGKQKTDVQS